MVPSTRQGSAGRDLSNRCAVQTQMNRATGKPVRPEGIAAAPRHPLPRPARWGLILALCVGLYALLGFVAVPWVIRTQLPEVVGDYTGGAAAVREVRFNPFTLALDLQSFTLREPSGAVALSFGGLHVDMGFQASLAGEVHLDRVKLADPYVRVAIDRQGRSNLSDLFGEKRSDQDKKSGAAGIPLAIDGLTVAGGRLEFQDRSHRTPFRQIVFPVDAELSNFTLGSQAESGGAASPYRLAAVSESGATLRLEGTLSTAPLLAEGTLRLDGLKARTLWEYARDRLGLAVASGTLDLAAHYRVADDPPRVTVRQGTLDLKQLRLAGLDSDRILVDIPSAQVRGIAADTQERRFAIGSAVSTDGRLETWLTPEGRFNLAAWFPPSAPGQNNGGPPQEEGAGWSVRVDEVTLDRYAAMFEDRSAPQAVRLNLSPLHLNLKNFATADDQPVRVALNAGLNESGKIGVAGDLSLASKSAELNVDLGHLPLPEFQPYLSRFARLDLVKGFLDLHGKLSVRQDAPNPPVLNYQGDASLGDLEARLPGANRPLLNWRTLAFSGLSFQSEPAQLHIADAAADRLYAQVEVKPDRTLNLAQVFIESKPEKSPGEPGSKPPMPIAVDMIRLENSQADFSDLFIQPNFSIGIHDLHGTLHGVNSKPGQPAKLLLEGRVDRHAPVKIEGKINLFSPTRLANVDMRFTNVDMTALSPYSGKFAGYRIRMGKMSLDLHYRLKDRRLDSANRIVLTHLTLGEPVPGSRAPDLPLHLAIALLKDSQGRINLDLPIRGDLSNPKVSFPNLVGDVLRGLIRKVVASPFQMLARLAGGGEDLSYVGFSPGEANLGNEQVAQLAKLGQALRERPALHLQITGVAGPERDRPALAEKELIDRIKAAKLLEQGRPVNSESLRNTVLSRSEYERFMTRLYVGKTGGRASSREGAVPIDAMKDALLRPEAIGQAGLRILARERAGAIRDYLIRSEGLEPTRIFVTDVQVEKDSGPLVRSRLGLRAS
jgi:hypothetical protein